jgi:hypothetical protein
VINKGLPKQEVKSSSAISPSTNLTGCDLTLLVIDVHRYLISRHILHAELSRWHPLTVQLLAISELILFVCDSYDLHAMPGNGIYQLPIAHDMHAVKAWGSSATTGSTNTFQRLL